MHVTRDPEAEVLQHLGTLVCDNVLVFEFVAVRVGEVPSQAKQDAAYRLILRADPCSYCGAPAEAADHIVPTSIGREHGWQNTTAACRHCNSKKTCRTLLAFLLGEPVGMDRWEKERLRQGRYYANLFDDMAGWLDREAA